MTEEYCEFCNKKARNFIHTEEGIITFCVEHYKIGEIIYRAESKRVAM